MKLQKIGCMFFWDARDAVLCKTNYEASDPNLRSYIEELCHYSYQEMFVGQQSSQAGRTVHFWFTFFTQLGQVCQEDERSYE